MPEVLRLSSKHRHLILNITVFLGLMSEKSDSVYFSEVGYRFNGSFTNFIS